MEEPGNIIILMVDDDADDRFLFEEALSNIDTGFNLTTASSGGQAISLLSTGNFIPDLIFLDISMPSIDGWDCLDFIKSRKELIRIPVIIYSTSESKRDIDKAYQKGAFCYCVKPDNFKDLTEMLRKITTNIGPGLYDALKECKDCKTIYFQGGENYRMLQE